MNVFYEAKKKDWSEKLNRGTRIRRGRYHGTYKAVLI